MTADADVSARLGAGDRFFDEGRLEPAIGEYQAVLDLEPGHAVAWFNLGAALSAAGRPDDAITCFRNALTAAPDLHQASYQLARLLQVRGDLEEAVTFYWQTIGRLPGLAEAHDGLGRALTALGRHKEAVASFRRALSLKPGSASILFHLGSALLASGEAAEAEDILGALCAAQPAFAEAHVNLGVALRALGRAEEARESFLRALEIRPDYPEALANMADALQDLCRWDEARIAYRRSLLLRPGHFHTLNRLGVCLMMLHSFEEAEAVLREAIGLNEADASGHMHLGNALSKLGRDLEAMAELRRAVELAPLMPSAWNNLGACLHDLGAFVDAIACWDQAIELAPEHASAHQSKGMALLLLGDWRSGWPEYEWRRGDPGGIQDSKRLGTPRWSGAERGRGRRILLQAEQGLGDTIQFLRYARLVAAGGDEPVLEVQERLRDLAQTVVPGAAVFAKGTEPPPHDAHCPLLSLPAVFGTEVASIPGEVPYLHPPAARVEAWRELPPARLRIGLVWAGSRSFANDRRRSIPLASMLRLCRIDGAQVIGLQKEMLSPDRDAAAQVSPLLLTGERLTDFADTAGLIANLDLVVSVDTAVAHLAGAMAKPVWILLPRVPDWRWLLDREDTPWYPTARLFRQEQAGQWEPVIDRVLALLEEARDRLADG